jgi:hypothetical protein
MIQKINQRMKQPNIEFLSVNCSLIRDSPQSSAQRYYSARSNSYKIEFKKKKPSYIREGGKSDPRNKKLSKLRHPISLQRAESPIQPDSAQITQ